MKTVLSWLMAVAAVVGIVGGTVLVDRVVQKAIRVTEVICLDENQVYQTIPPEEATKLGLFIIKDNLGPRLAHWTKPPPSRFIVRSTGEWGLRKEVVPYTSP